ncbi:histidine protein methyltransferase 1 homolog isoform X2 [Lingula anatina]|uniref:protein-histidine N-methyltransferase n=1 Tax=Lingula anatina TaxID=7574 RepID=A0A1S3IMH0_LINAN|nr:histidine protein methyltransferase 1 homolog isoform X2 [Lingula anatina]|eukprot:XP_013398729.1 histidine protein methyltransferase 1 homolog isoform X2 [Lingula anatina]
MAFRFNFNQDDSGIAEEVNGGVVPVLEKKAEMLAVAEAVELEYEEEKLQLEDVAMETLTTSEGEEVKYCSAEDIQDRLNQEKTDSVIVRANSSNSDLIPHVYEGGLKVWECSVDLTHYLSGLKLAFRGLKVLELGCGAGLPGLYTYCQGALVDFQDYNKEVLQYVTMCNVFLNTPPDHGEWCRERCGYYAGDWSMVLQLLNSRNKKYDLILTSETIYSLESQQSLLSCLQELIKDDGDIYVAAKTCYFGVGGSTQNFQDLVSKNAVLDVEVVKTFTDE